MDINRSRRVKRTSTNQNDLAEMRRDSFKADEVLLKPLNPFTPAHIVVFFFTETKNTGHMKQWFEFYNSGLFLSLNPR